MPRYDVKAVCAAVRAEQVIQYLGIDHLTRGGRLYIRCPEPSHADRNIGNCVVRDTGYHCFACGGHGSMVDLVMKSQNMGFVEAVETLADIAGGRHLFVQEGEATRQWAPSATTLSNVGLSTTLTPNASPDVPKVAEIWKAYGDKPIKLAAAETAKRMKAMADEASRQGKLGTRIAQLLGDANGVTDEMFARFRKECTARYIQAMKETDA